MITKNTTEQNVMPGIKNQVQCPSCGSYKVQSTKTLGVILILLGLGFCWLIVPLIFVLFGLAILILPKKYTCLNCHYSFKK